MALQVKKVGKLVNSDSTLLLRLLSLANTSFSPKQLITHYNSPGTDQLKEFLGKPRKGDTCQLHIVGNVIPKTKRTGFLSCIPQMTEFIATTHINKRVTVEIGRKGYDGLYRGLHEALQEMNFGDEVTFFIPSQLAFGSQGLSRADVGRPNPDHVDRNPVQVSFIRVEPDQDLEVKITFFRLYRDGQWHNRKIKNHPTFFNAGFHSCM